jgi:hypothetical protein
MICLYRFNIGRQFNEYIFFLIDPVCQSHEAIAMKKDEGHLDWNIFMRFYVV